MSTIGIGPRTVIGLSLVAFGAMAGLHELGVLDKRHFLAYWPILFIAFGASCANRRNGPVAFVLGLVVVAAATWLLLIELGILNLRIAGLAYPTFDMIGPWALAAVGIWILAANAMRVLANGKRGAEGTGQVMDVVAIFGGYQKKESMSDFRKGRLVAIFGGAELDLRKCSIPSGRAVLNIVAVFGGAEIIVPRGWNVVAGTMPIMGGVSDSTSSDGDGPELVVRGTAIFGGLEIRN